MDEKVTGQVKSTARKPTARGGTQYMVDLVDGFRASTFDDKIGQAVGGLRQGDMVDLEYFVKNGYKTISAVYVRSDLEGTEIPAANSGGPVTPRPVITAGETDLKRRIAALDFAMRLSTETPDWYALLDQAREVETYLKGE
jgi:hypothetical protein